MMVFWASTNIPSFSSQCQTLVWNFMIGKKNKPQKQSQFKTLYFPQIKKETQGMWEKLFKNHSDCIKAQKLLQIHCRNFSFVSRFVIKCDHNLINWGIAVWNSNMLIKNRDGELSNLQKFQIYFHWTNIPNVTCSSEYARFRIYELEI